MATFLRYRTVDGYLSGGYVADAAQPDPAGEASVDVSTATVDPAAGNGADTTRAGWLTDPANTVYEVGSNTVRLANAGEAAAKDTNTRAATRNRLKAEGKASYDAPGPLKSLQDALITAGSLTRANLDTAIDADVDALADRQLDDWQLDDWGPQ
jgi:hypothetical protein